MAWYVSTLVGIVFGLLMWRWSRNRDYTIGKWHLFCWTFLGAVIVGPLASIFCIQQTSHDHPTAVNQPIVSLGDGSGVDGHFFLGFGTVGSHGIYTYYTGDSVNGFRSFQADARYTDIQYTSGTPHMTLWCRDWTKSADWAQMPFWKIGHKPDDIWDGGCRGGEYNDIDVWTTFYVPAGSVKSNYNLDAQ